MKTSLVILAIVSAYGCAERIELPNPPVNQLNEDDRHVLSIAIGAALAEEYGKPTLSEIAFVAPDVTIRACELPEYDPSGYDCMPLDHLRAVGSMLQQRFSPHAAGLFERVIERAFVQAAQSSESSSLRGRLFSNCYADAGSRSSARNFQGNRAS
jgi:hypothetical protein